MATITLRTTTPISMTRMLIWSWTTNDQTLSRLNRSTPAIHLMSTRNTNASFETVNFYFGEQHLDTLQEFDQLSHALKRSRTGTLHYLLTHYKWYHKHNLVSLG